MTDKIPFHKQYEALKNKQEHLAFLMAEHEEAQTLIRRRRFWLTIVYLVFIGSAMGMSIWLFYGA